MLPLSAPGIVLVERDGVTLEMEVHTVGRIQSLDHRADIKEAAEFAREDVASGFQHAIGNIGWRLRLEDYAEVFFDATMASRTHADKWWGHEGYLIIRRLPDESPLSGANVIFNHIDVKAGHFVVDFGNELQRRTFNARSGTNPLVGNPIVSPHAAEAGIELRHAHASGFGAMAGFGSGVASESFDHGTRPSYRGKLWYAAPENDGVEAAVSYYRSDHGPDLARGANLFRTERLGGQYAGIWDDGNAPGQVIIGDGTNLTAWQVDLGWRAPEGRGGLWGHWGQVTDDRGETDEEWQYYGVTAQYYIRPNAIYLAGRYSVADARTFQSSSDLDGMLDRWQFGGGIHVLPGMLLKLEWVIQRTRGFDDGVLSGIALAENPRFSGLIAEIAFSF